MATNGWITKEDFKKYMNGCPKIAWTFHNLENFKTVIGLKKQKQIEIHYKIPLDDENDFDSSEGFNPIDLYSALLEKEDDELEDFEREQKKILIDQINDLNGFQPTGLAAETIIDGLEVGQAAREYFIDKLYWENQTNNTNFKYFDFQNFSYNKTIEQSKEYLNNSNFKYLFEPAFESTKQKLKIRCDVLINNGNNHVTIVEFKASTKSKAEHFFDVWYQKEVLELNGFIVDDVKIGLINKNYVRGIGVDEFKDVFLVEDIFIDFESEVLPLIGKLKKPISGESDLVYRELIRLTNVLESSQKRVSFLEYISFSFINGHYFKEIINEIRDFFGLEPSTVLFRAKCKKYSLNHNKKHLNYKYIYCQHIVKYYDKKEYNLYELTRFKQKASIIHWNEPKFVYLKNIVDLNHEIFSYEGKYLFGPDEIRVINCVTNYLTKGSLDIYKFIKFGKYFKVINLLKDYYKYPVYMYDFETVKWAIPKYDNSWSYEQIPFQYSIHVINDASYDFKNPSETMDHFNFIASKQEDPRPEFLVRFINDCFAKGPGIYVAYNMSFEKSVIKNLIYSYPKFKKPLTYIYQNTIDLMEFFKLKGENWLIYHPNFRGSYSIKKTQPGLDNTLNYSDLKINKGDKASQTFRQFLDNIISQEEYDVILKEDMLKYCDRDTLAMVVVLQKIVENMSIYKENFLKDIEKALENDKNV